MNELNEIDEILKKMCDEIAILMRRRKITLVKIMANGLNGNKISRPKAMKVVSGNGKKEELAEVLEFCRNYKEENNG